MLFRSNDTATTEIYTLSDTLSLHDALPIAHRVIHVHAKEIPAAQLGERGRVTGTRVGVAVGDGVIDFAGVIGVLASDPESDGLQSRTMPVAQDTECFFMPLCMHSHEISVGHFGK